MRSTLERDHQLQRIPVDRPHCVLMNSITEAGRETATEPDKLGADSLLKHSRSALPRHWAPFASSTRALHHTHSTRRPTLASRTRTPGRRPAATLPQDSWMTWPTHAPALALSADVLEAEQFKLRPRARLQTRACGSSLQLDLLQHRDQCCRGTGPRSQAASAHCTTLTALIAPFWTTGPARPEEGPQRPCR